MHISHHVTLAAAPPRFARGFTAHEAVSPRGALDRRWPSVRGVLQILRAARRRSVRIVDLRCGGGDLLLHTARAARALGFVSVEVCGVDRDGAAIAEARRAAGAIADRGIGAQFAVAEPAALLAGEADFPADLVLCDAEQALDADLMRAAAASGRQLICASAATGRHAA